jgi:hypothetical protein
MNGRNIKQFQPWENREKQASKLMDPIRTLLTASRPGFLVEGKEAMSL